MTGARAAGARAGLTRIGPPPIYLNEERRADPGAHRPSRVSGRLLGCENRRRIGLMFHTAAGFELRKKAFLDALSAEERAGLQALRPR